MTEKKPDIFQGDSHMTIDIAADQIEIITEFVQESREMLDHLEPTIIELGQSCQATDCWSLLGCEQHACPRFGQQVAQPCWLDRGFLQSGDQTCIHAASEQDCKDCPAFRAVNGDPETMNAIFRLFHSMKGSAGFLELNNIAGVAHAAESLLDLVRSGQISLASEHIDYLCQSCDFARVSLDCVEESYQDHGMEAQAELIRLALESAIENAQLQARGEVTPAAAGDPGSTGLEDLPSLEMLITPEMLERFCQEAEELLQNAEQDLLAFGEKQDDADALADLFRNMHSFKGNCGFFGFADMERLAHQMETVLEHLKDGHSLPDDNSADILLNVIDHLQTAVNDIGEGHNGRIPDLEQRLAEIQKLMPPKIGDLLTGEGVPKEFVEAAATSQKKRLGEILVEQGKASPEQVNAALQKQQAARESSTPATRSSSAPRGATVSRKQDIRVDLDKLDKLIDLIGEIVIAENMLIFNPDLKDLELENFNKAGQQMDKLIRELQEMAMIIRMIPISGLFRRMIRLVHDISAKAGKKVDLKLYGEDTEIDKTVIETIADPLVHLLRNSLDHGLETPEQRLASGKPEKGTIRLSACHEEGEIWITIEDDGRGLNREKILAKARERGMVAGDGADLNDKAVFNLIFQPGFSTAEKITDISGRGVGMDVVKQNLEKIKGSIDINSRPGQGTRINLRIPLTLGIIDGMLIRNGSTKCIIPLQAIREIFKPGTRQLTVTPDGGEYVRVRENFLSVLRLHEILHNEPDERPIESGILIVLEHQDQRICLLADEILGQQQTVIKGLSDYLGHVQVASGCTILGDGKVCNILDFGNLVTMKKTEEA
jgi:two-component system chemotaxis sensor kinase CheA